MKLYRIILSSWLRLIWSVINGWGKWCLHILFVCVEAVSYIFRS